MQHRGVRQKQSLFLFVIGGLALSLTIIQAMAGCSSPLYAGPSSKAQGPTRTLNHLIFDSQSPISNPQSPESGRLSIIDRDAHTVQASTSLRPGDKQRGEVDIHTPDSTPAATPTPGATLVWTKEEGTRIKGGIPYVVSLPEGGFRLYFCRSGGIHSAISSDGLHFTEEPGVRIRGGCDPSLVPLDTGGYRMYYKVQVDPNTHVIYSATSSDGLAWTKEGLRFQNLGAPCYGWTSVPNAVRLPDGRVRLYFVCNKDQGAIASALSNDGLHFTLEDGFRLERVLDPNVLPLADGTYRMFYATSPEGERLLPPRQIYTARSTDGLNWTVEGEVLAAGGPYDTHAVADPSAIQLPSGNYRVYYTGDGDKGHGTILSAVSRTSSPVSNIQSPYLLAFHACDAASANCRDPRNHHVFLAQSDNGADWSLVPDWEPYQGSVPDVIRRGDTLYVYTPGQVRRYRFSTNTWEDPVPVTLIDPEATGGYVDPSLFVDDQGRLVLFYLLGIIGQDPAGCAPGETTCVKHFHSAVEEAGSDGTVFVAQPGDRVQVTIGPSGPPTASDPDIFYDGSRYVLYISRGSSIQVYTSPTLHGSYTLLDTLPGGYLTHTGGVSAGYFDPTTRRYWTYVFTQGGIGRAVHESLSTPLSTCDFNIVLTAESVGLGTHYQVGSPGFAVNTPGDRSPTTTPVPSAVATPSSSRPWRIYSPLVIERARRSWPTPTPTASAPTTPTDTPTATPTTEPTITPTPTPTPSADVSFRIGDPLPDMPIRPLLGVNAGPTPVGAAGNADLTSAYQDIGVTMVRTHDFYGPLDMATMYPDRTKDPNDPASFDFTASDAAFAAIVAGGFEPYLRLGDSWNDVTPPANARERANWVQAAVNVVRHYREGLWGGFEANVRYVEIWNEPDNPQFWPNPHTDQAFFQLYTETAQALKAAFPGLEVGGAGFSPAGALTPRGQRFVRDFLDYVRDHGAPLDFLSWHLYANDPADFASAASFYRNLLDEKGFSNVAMHVTEWNTSTQNVGSDEAVALRNGAKGAALMSAAWIALQDADVEAATFYRGGDQGPDMTAGHGLFYADGRPKKMALAFALWARLAAHPQRLTLTASPDDVLWSLAGQNEMGEIAVLVVNPANTATTYTFTDILGQPLSHYEVSVSEVSDTTSSTRVFTPSTGIIPIGAYTVHLVRLSPVSESTPTPTAPPTATPPATGGAVTIPVGESDPADPTVKPLLGVIAGPDPNAGFTEPNLTTQYQDIGVLSVRNNDYYDDRLDMEGIFNCGGPTYPSWEGCDPNDDANYNWGPSDAQFASYLAGGFEPFLRLGGEWENRNRPHDFKGPQNATQEANWIIAAHKVVDRYLHWDGAEQTFTYLDIWTEFPGNHFWDRSPIEFINFWVKAYASLKGAYPQLKVGGPGFGAGETMKVIQGDAELSRALLTKLYDQGLHLDWLGWHLFSNDPTQWTQAARAYRQLLDGTGPYADVPWAGTGFFADTEMIVDAYGFSSRSTDGTPPPQGARRASLLTAAWIAMQYGDVERANYYRGSDYGASSPGDGSGGPGLFYGDAAGTYKPSAHAFRLWSQVYGDYPHLLQVTLPSTDPEAPLWVLAAQNDQGDIALLVSNPSADTVTWSPRFADGTTLQDYGRVEIYQVDRTHDGRTSTPLTGASVTTPAYTVQLLTFHPADTP